MVSISEISSAGAPTQPTASVRRSAGTTADSVHAFLEANLSEMLVQLTDWVRIRSIAGAADTGMQLEASAAWLARQFREIGFPTVDVIPTGQSFAVYAEWCPNPAAPTYLIYSHHDVRAARESSWSATDAFSPVMRGNRLYGRGSSDAKGQALAHLWGVRAHLAQQDRSHPAVNLKFLIEGEEELGSPNLSALLESNTDRFAADVIVFSDTLQWSAQHPAVCTSIRGMISAHLELHGPAKDVHSGAVSGAAPNPIIELSGLIAKLHNQEGRIALPGFYDDVEEPTIQRRGELADLPFDEGRWIRESATGRVAGEAGYSVLERLWLRPSLEVISVTGGDTIDPPRAVIPAAAQADLSIRTVPGQTSRSVASQLRRFFSEHVAESEYTLNISEETAQEPYVTPDHPAVHALARAMEVGHRVSAVGRMGNAGGGPAELMSRVLGAPVVFYGTGLVEDNWHNGDESVDTGMLEAGAATLAVFWDLVAQEHRPASTSSSQDMPVHVGSRAEED